MEDKENVQTGVKPSPKKASILGPINDPKESAVLGEIQARKQSMGSWRGKTPTGKALPGGRKRKTRKMRKMRRKTLRRRA